MLHIFLPLFACLITKLKILEGLQYTCIHTYIRMCTCMHVYTHVYAHMRIYMHTHVYMHVYACMHVYMYACIYACVHVCMCICVYTCIHVWGRTGCSLQHILDQDQSKTIVLWHRLILSGSSAAACEKVEPQVTLTTALQFTQRNCRRRLYALCWTNLLQAAWTQTQQEWESAITTIKLSSTIFLP